MMEYSGDPISYFNRIFKEKKDVRLLNVYKGVPISNLATITAIGSSAITIKTEKFQIVSLYRERETYIQSDLTATTIRARVQHIDFANTQAVLSKFDYPKGFIGARTQVRVEPEEPVQGAVITKDMRRPFSAELADISQNGLAIFIKERFFLPAAFCIEAVVTIFLPLPPIYHVNRSQQRPIESWEKKNDFDNQTSSESFELNPLDGTNQDGSPLERSTAIPDQKVIENEIELHGTIVNIRKDLQHSRYRIGIRLQGADRAGDILTQFISQRQSEIISEIKAVYNLLSVISTQ
jgi:hypothetical protein